MADAPIKKGDVVILKSGGPIMFVSDIDGDYANCGWFDGKKPQRKLFKLSSLIHAEPPKIGMI